MSNKDIRAVIGLVNNGKSFPAVSLVKTNPDLAATISKLVHSRQQAIFDANGNKSASNIDKGNFTELSRDIVEKTTDSESIMQLFPDMELAAQILISSVISPKDMTSTEIIYTATNSILTSEVSAALIVKVKDYYEQEYKIKPLLPKILREALFETGSYVVAVIPESSIDEIINGSEKIGIESIAEYVDKEGDVVNYGILGDPRKDKTSQSDSFISVETFKEYNSTKTYDGFLTHSKDNKTESLLFSKTKVIDNPHILKLPKVFVKLKEQRINAILKPKLTGNGVAFESKNSKLTDSQMQSLLYKNKERGTNLLVRVKTKDQAARNTVGRPLILKLPSESVIPVHVPGNEQEHIGYFVLIDSEGNPLNRSSNQNYFTDLQSRLNNQSNTMSSYLLQKAKAGAMGGANSNHLSIDQATRLYSDIIESDLLERLRTGAYGSNVSIAKNEEIYRVMLARTLANQTTQLLYLPAELVTYFAYKYNKNGIGKSLHDDLRILNSLRAMMMFSRIMASLKNSIGRTEVKLKLDERDTDPQKTIETAVHEISKTRQQYFPLGMNSPVDLVDWIQKSGFEFTFEGHPKIPDMQIEFNEKNSNYVKPDTDLDEELKKRAIMGIGLSPETVDNGFSSEFATTVVANNLLLAKRVIQIQEHISPLLTDHAKKIAKNDGNLLDDLRGIIRENYEKIKNSNSTEEELKDFETNKEGTIEYLLNDFINTIELSLPQPNSVTLENQMVSFTIYSEALDKCLDAWISSEIVNSNMSGEVNGNVDNVKAIIKAHYLRKWMSENNVLTELAELTTNDENGNPMLNFVDIQKDHINGLVRSIVHLYKETKPVGIASDKDLANIGGGDGIVDSNGTTPDSTNAFDAGGEPDGAPAGLEPLDDLPADDTGGMPADLPALDYVE